MSDGRNAEGSLEIWYFAGEDTPADRHNIWVLARVVTKSTVPLHAVIFYDRPLRLSNWAWPQENLRFTRRNTLDIGAQAVELAGSKSATAVLCDYRVLLHPQDLWLLLGYGQRFPLVLFWPQRCVRDKNEPLWRFAWRCAATDFRNYLGAHKPQDVLCSFNHRLLPPFSDRPFSKLKFYHRLLVGKTTLPAERISCRSKAIAAKDYPWLSGVSDLFLALRLWKKEKRFPFWLTSRHFIFPVAQLAMYVATMALWIDVKAALVFAGFAVFLTPCFLFRDATLLLKILFVGHPLRWLKRLLFAITLLFFRLLFYFVG